MCHPVDPTEIIRIRTDVISEIANGDNREVDVCEGLGDASEADGDGRVLPVAEDAHTPVDGHAEARHYHGQPRGPF